MRLCISPSGQILSSFQGSLGSPDLFDQTNSIVGKNVLCKLSGTRTLSPGIGSLATRLQPTSQKVSSQIFPNCGPRAGASLRPVPTPQPFQSARPRIRATSAPWEGPGPGRTPDCGPAPYLRAGWHCRARFFVPGTRGRPGTSPAPPPGQCCRAAAFAAAVPGGLSCPHVPPPTPRQLPATGPTRPAGRLAPPAR